MENTSATSAPADTTSTSSEGTSADTNSVTSTSVPDAQATSATPTPEAVKQAEKRRYKLNVYGKEEEVEYDDETITKELQKARAASKTREEAAKERQEVERMRAEYAQKDQQIKQIFDLLKNPSTARQILRQLGTPVEELGREELEEYVKYQQMTPEQRELHELRQEKAQRAEQERVWKEQQAQREYQEQVQAAQERFSGTIVAAMGKLGLSETDARASSEIAQRLAFKLEQSLALGEPLSPDDLAEELREDMREQHRILYGKLPGEQLFGLLGEDALKKAHEYAAKRVPQVPSVDNPPRQEGQQTPGNGIPKFKTKKEFDAYVDSLPSLSLDLE